MLQIQSRVCLMHNLTLFFMSDHLEETSFDYIVLGTGFIESILAGYCIVRLLDVETELC